MKIPERLTSAKRVSAESGISSEKEGNGQQSRLAQRRGVSFYETPLSRFYYYFLATDY